MSTNLFPFLPQNTFSFNQSPSYLSDTDSVILIPDRLPTASFIIMTQLLRLFVLHSTFLWLMVDGFLPTTTPPHTTTTVFQAEFRQSKLASRIYGKSSDSEDEEDEDEVALQDDDWRAFRAKLVMGEKSSDTKLAPSEEDSGDLDGIGSLFSDAFGSETGNSHTSTSNDGIVQDMTPLEPSQYAYDSGEMIEQGSVILGGVEQEYGFGLRQQYFHKAAILVLDHDENTFTKGIILNRPTDLMLEDDVNPGKKWRVWFGGDVEGLNAKNPDIVCLHSLKNEKASSASIPVMNDIQWTTFTNAKRLVKAGVADVRDFWVFVGYAGWGPGQLKGELERKSWYMVATDSQTLLKELARQAEGADPRDAGLDTWTLLMKMIGRGETAKEHSGDFDDLMLKEWALGRLLSSASGGGGGQQHRDPNDFNTNPELVESLIRVIKSSRESSASFAGALVRASPAERSPFLLDNQELHKSIVLILVDDESASIGVVLNRPSTKGLDIKVSDKTTGKEKVVRIPMRFGGQYSVQGQEPLLWLHCNPTLKRLKIGSPIGGEDRGIWKCTAQDVMTAVGQGNAKARDFLVVSGVSIWAKDLATQGIEGEIDSGRFKLLPSSARDHVWSSLLEQQEVLNEDNFDETLSLAAEVWASADPTTTRKPESQNASTLTPMGGLGEGFDEDDDSFVFKSDVKVAKLADDALRSWCATFLLGMPSLGK
eukprot:scaffold11032_cov122-Cylindrotheca_fusiformis.AAC.13